MQQKLMTYRGLAVFLDLYLDRMIYATLILAALFAGAILQSL